MKQNEGGIDRIVRAILGIAALAIAFTTLDVMGGTLPGIIVAAVGAILLITAIIGYCPAYKIFGLQTCPLKNCPANCGGDGCS
ncbi:MAG: DUF2892 domain-containing protein [Phycisphaeraceae bacterium]|nr:DUF2892 domain-containing protein [Phycisphaeraceae bacterium]MCB9847430.1 DUF2892 domain-containing protein [Phycisphaeraceae bacterium]